jgi:hypothetical protein
MATKTCAGVAGMSRQWLNVVIEILSTASLFQSF